MNFQQQEQPRPIPEVIDRNLPECIVQPVIWVVPQDRTQPPVSRMVEVARRYDADQAYQVQPIQGFHPRPLSHGNRLWGYVLPGFILERCAYNGNVFVENKSRRVIIKKLFRKIVDDDIAHGSRENPYREIMRMKECAGRNQVGNIDDNDRRAEGFVRNAYANDHVLGCIDAAANEKYLYIISPYCERQSLWSHVPLRPKENASVEAQARKMYRQMLENIEYLHEGFGICHRDICPGNFLVRGDHRILLNDLAMSVQIPPNGGGLEDRMRPVGKSMYWPPETLQRNYPLLPRRCDLWACTIVLWNLVTGMPLYSSPRTSDIIFKYAILGGGLSLNFTNKWVERAIEEANAEELILIIRVALAILGLSKPLLELFQNTLKVNVAERWTREQVLASDWMNMS